MDPIVESVEELVARSPDRNNREIFLAMWSVLSELKERIAQRFRLELEPSVRDLSAYGSPDGSTQGHLAAYGGDEIDWMIHSYMGTPEKSFSNMHLTVWLGPQVRVPHFGMALGTIPNLFCYLDFIPRVDLMADVEYLDRYYEPLNGLYLAFEQDPEFRPFVSRSLYMRQAQSRTSLCYSTDPHLDRLNKISKAAHKVLDQWFKHLDQAHRVDPKEQAALAERDLLIRRTISDRDPANVMGAKIFGQTLTDRLVGVLWGKGRQLKRAGSWQQ
jgi:hypothetical protein